MKKEQNQESGISPVISVILLLGLTISVTAIGVLTTVSLSHGSGDIGNVVLKVSADTETATVVKDGTVEKLRLAGNPTEFITPVNVGDSLDLTEGGTDARIVAEEDGNERLVRQVTDVKESTRQLSNPSISAPDCSTVSYNGSGTQNAPFNVSTDKQLQCMDTVDHTGVYQLVTNIDASRTEKWNGGEGFRPVGDSSTNKFRGELRGNGQTIESVTINRSNETAVGLFGETANSNVQNVVLTKLTVKGGSQTGGLVGNDFQTTVRNVSVSGTVDGDAETGGLVGKTTGVIVRNSAMSGTVSGSNKVGGLVGITRPFGARPGAIEKSSATADVTASGNFAGGLVGRDFDTNGVSNSSASGSVTGQSTVGGLVGDSRKSVVDNSTASGPVTGGFATAGLVGSSRDGTVKNATASGTVSATDTNAGGLVGISKNSTVEDSSVTSDVTGTNVVGGLIGKSENSVVEDSASSGTIDGGFRTAGLVAQSEDSVVSNSTTTSPVTGTLQVGGLVAFNSGSVFASSASGSATGNTQVGGLVGSNFDDGTVASSSARATVQQAASGFNFGGLIGVNRGDIENSTAGGTVDATESDEVGGLVGSSTPGSTISNTSSTADVTGRAAVGGLAGKANDSTVTDSFAVGTVTGDVTASTNGFVGNNEGDTSIIRDSYFDDSSSGTTQNGGVGGTGDITGLPTDRMQGSDASQNGNMDSLDFTATGEWKTTNTDYPVLQARE